MSYTAVKDTYLEMFTEAPSTAITNRFVRAVLLHKCDVKRTGHSEGSIIYVELVADLNSTRLSANALLSSFLFDR